MDYNQRHVISILPQGNPSILRFTMNFIINCQHHRIAEYFGRPVETNSMLLDIILGFGRIPRKIVIQAWFLNGSNCIIQIYIINANYAPCPTSRVHPGQNSIMNHPISTFLRQKGEKRIFSYCLFFK